MGFRLSFIRQSSLKKKDGKTELKREQKLTIRQQTNASEPGLSNRLKALSLCWSLAIISGCCVATITQSILWSVHGVQPVTKKSKHTGNIGTLPAVWQLLCFLIMQFHAVCVSWVIENVSLGSCFQVLCQRCPHLGWTLKHAQLQLAYWFLAVAALSYW